MKLHFLALALLPLLVACEALSSSPQANAPAQPLAALFSSTAPDEIARSFLDAWNAISYEAMYRAISSRSQARYTLEIFQNRYELVKNSLQLSAISYTLGQWRQQGESAELSYSVTLQSPAFGSIEDSERLMRFVREEGQWRIAWSPQDIISGLAGDARLLIESRRAPRGNIYDRNGSVLAESNGTIAFIGVIKQDMASVDRCLDSLARILQRPRFQLAQRFANFNPDTWFHVAELDPETLAANRDELNANCALNNESAGFRKTGTIRARRYVGHGAAAHVTGYIGRIPADQLAIYEGRGYQAGDLVGLTGIEALYEAQLSGQAERIVRIVEPGGTTIRELGGAQGQASKPVQLTIDWPLQNATAQAISDAYNYAAINWASVAGGAAAVVVDVKNGQLLALASYPTFDPGLFNPTSSYQNPVQLISELSADRRRPLANKALQEQYTPGSIYKLITAVAALEEGVYGPDEPFVCELEWANGPNYGDTVGLRQDWRVADGLPAAGEITVRQAIAASCNPFFWEMGGLLYRQRPSLLADYSEQFGLGQRYGLGLSNEASGSVARPNSPSQAINNAIGQGDVQVTALQMAMAVSVIANGGTLYEPQIVLQVGGFDRVAVEQPFQVRVRREVTVSDRTLAIVREGMCLVTTDRTYGTGIRVFGDAPYTSCGKTGTAETGVRGSGSPPHAWYVAFAPADDPQIAIAVIVANSREGSEVAAPIARRILDAYFNVPAAPFPRWWEEPYVPLEAPAGVSG